MAKVASQGEKNLETISKNMEGVEKATVDLGMVLPALEGSLESSGKAISAVFEDPVLAAAATMGNLGIGIAVMSTKLKDMPRDMDESFAGLTKATGVSSKLIHDSMVYMMDPLYAARKDETFRGLAEDAKPLANIGMHAKETGASFQAMIEGASLFRPQFIANNKASSVFVANLMGGLKKLGVPLAASAKNIDIFTKAMQMTPMQAAKGVKSLVSVADSLGLSMKKVQEDFGQVAMSTDLLAFGDNAVDVF